MYFALGGSTYLSQHLLLFDRRFEREGTMNISAVKHTSAERKKHLLKKKNLYFFLFHDVLVLCTTKKFFFSRDSANKTFEHIETVYLSDMQVCAFFFFSPVLTRDS